MPGLFSASPARRAIGGRTDHSQPSTASCAMRRSWRWASRVIARTAALKRKRRPGDRAVKSRSHQNEMLQGRAAIAAAANRQGGFRGFGLMSLSGNCRHRVIFGAQRSAAPKRASAVIRGGWSAGLLRGVDCETTPGRFRTSSKLSQSQITRRCGGNFGRQLTKRLNRIVVDRWAIRVVVDSRAGCKWSEIHEVGSSYPQTVSHPQMAW
jgi:hypothetical protein